MSEKEHKYFFGQMPEMPWKVKDATKKRDEQAVNQREHSGADEIGEAAKAGSGDCVGESREKPEEEKEAQIVKNTTYALA